MGRQFYQINEDFIVQLIQDFEKTQSHEKRENQYSGTVFTPVNLADIIIINLFKLYLKDILKKLNYDFSKSLSKTIDIENLRRILEKNSNLKDLLEKEISSLKILDPACGTGIFLISVGNFLLKINKIINPDLIEYNIKKYIIQNVLFGIDIDKRFCIISKLRLLAWLLSTENKTSTEFFNKKQMTKLEDFKALFDQMEIKFNIRNIDYLVEFNTEEKFDIIIGNPPYIENKKILNSDFKNKLKDRYISAYKLYDLSILFIEKSLNSLKDEGGYLSFILPNKFLAADYGIKIRELLINNSEIKEIINISSLSLFPNTSTYPIILSLKKAESTGKNSFLVKNYKNFDSLFRNHYIKTHKVEQGLIDLIPSKIIPLSNNIELIRYMYSNFKPMSDVFKELKIIYRPFGFIDWARFFNYLNENKNSNKDLLVLGTGNVGKYHIKYKKLIKIAKKTFSVSYFNFDQKFKNIWDDLENEKLIFREIAKDITFVYDPGNFTNITGLYFLRIRSFNTDKYFCLLAILNSKLIDILFKSLFGSLHMAGDYIRFNGSFIKRIPIPNELPVSLARLGKIQQFLIQYHYILENYPQSTINIPKSHIHEQISFFNNLVDSIVLFLYFKKKFESSDKIFNQIKDLQENYDMTPDMGEKELYFQLNSPSFNVYNFSSQLTLIEDFYFQLSNNSGLIEEMGKILRKGILLQDD
jgi:hypothetical protein